MKLPCCKFILKQLQNKTDQLVDIFAISYFILYLCVFIAIVVVLFICKKERETMSLM